jgi:predicted regulator of Ras-like GTPase activity (Roadblock/LC7/MglB family)
MFQATLAKLVAQAGAHWAMIVGSDGVLLETDRPSFRGEAESMAAVYAAFYRAARKAATDTDMAGLPTCLLELEPGKILLQALTAEYFLVLFLSSQEPAGKALFEMSRVTAPLARELRF